MSQFLRGQIGRGEDRFTGLAGRGREVAGVLQLGRAARVGHRVGRRGLRARGRQPPPAHARRAGRRRDGGLQPVADRPAARSWASGWRSAGLGSQTPAPTAFGIIGTLGAGFLGAMGLLRTVLTLGMIPLGALFAYRLPAPTGSRWAQIACLLVYVTVPLPYNALADGRWGALVLYAAAPAAGGAARQPEPGRAVRAGRRTGTRRCRPGRGAAGCWRSDFVTALVAAILPSAVIIVVGMAVALSLGGLVAMNPQGSVRMIGGALAAAGVAVLLHLPWTLDFLGPGTTLSSFTGVPRTDQVSDLAALLRFEVGPLGGAPLGWCFLVAAALPLLIARAERHAWAVRGWTLAVVSFGVAWAAQRGDLPVALPAVDVLLVPAAAGLALATAMGVAAFEVDLPGYRFGWRQIASGLAAAAVVAGIVPVARRRRSTGAGRCRLATTPERWASSTPRTTRRPSACSGSAIPAAVPLGGWALEDGLVYGTTDDGAPTLENLWVGSDDGPSAPARRRARHGQHGPDRPPRTALGPDGRALRRRARSGWRRNRSRRPDLPVPPAVTATLEAQLDLEPVDVPAGLTVYRNQAFMPLRAGVPAVRGDPRGRGHRERRSASTCPARPRSSRTRRDGSAGPVRSRTTPPCCSRPRAPTDGSWRSTAPRSNGSSPSGGATASR